MLSLAKRSIESGNKQSFIQTVTYTMASTTESSTGGELAGRAEKNLGGTTPPEQEVKGPEYPQGLRLFFIVTALVLAIFLNSLDIVSPMSHAVRNVAST